MYCTSCGSKIVSGSSFCTNCGKSFEQYFSNETIASKNNNRLDDKSYPLQFSKKTIILVSACLVIIFLIIGMGYFYFNIYSSKANLVSSKKIFDTINVSTQIINKLDNNERDSIIVINNDAIQHIENEAGEVKKISLELDRYENLSSIINVPKMNLFYIGIDNPIEISSTEIASDEIALVVSNASTRKISNGNFIVNPIDVGNSIVTVSARLDGKDRIIGTKMFRSKRIPDPIPTVGGKLRGGNAQASTIKAEIGLVALLPNFDFEANFTVQSFTMMFSSKGEIYKSETTGPIFNEQMQGYLNRAKPKDIVIFDNIIVVGPDGISRRIGQIAFNVI